ncbi:MAG: Ppx/GppA family phosphatase [Deltaproteobacteria bacterium]|nr:Ppx/GppA family phosphatase [Deltaproteobacteria bacterium]
MSGPTACVDLGTNTCLLLVAEPYGAGHRVLVDVSRITRLGQGVDRARVLHPDARARVLACLGDYARMADAHGATRRLLVTTSAMRDAADGPAFLAEIRERTGFDARIIGGDEEAELTWLSAAADFARPCEPMVAFDVGGGSTEVMQGEGARLVSRRSLEVGGVRLTERLLSHDPPTPGELTALRAAVRDALPGAAPPPGARLVGLAGTVTTLACVARARPTHDAQGVHGSALSRDDVTALVDALAALPARERLRHPALDPGRADVIVAGAAIVEAVMAWAGASSLVVSNGGVRWGLYLRAVTGRAG